MAPRKVLVTGAGGRTGLKTLRKMAERPDLFQAIGTARTAESAAEVVKQTGAQCVVCNVSDPESVATALRGIETLVILSSSTPKPNKLKLLGYFAQRVCLCNSQARMGAAFEYPKGGEPKIVDWEGQRNLVDAAKAAGIQHIVIVGSMGGTDADHFLNKMGGGDILLWKRKGELHAISSGVPYTIIHPGGLLPHWGNKVVPGGERHLVVGVDDELMSRKYRSIPREDVAEIVCQCVIDPAAKGRIFDVVSEEPANSAGKVWDKTLSSLLAPLGGKNCDYSKPEHPILGNVKA